MIGKSSCGQCFAFGSVLTSVCGLLKIEIGFGKGSVLGGGEEE